MDSPSENTATEPPGGNRVRPDLDWKRAEPFSGGTRFPWAFSPDGETPIGDGSWIKRQWRGAQRAAGIARPISWHDLRHLFVSLLIAAGKHPKYIAPATRHRDPGFSLRTYGHLFDSLPVTAVEWWDDLLWPTGCPFVPTEKAYPIEQRELQEMRPIRLG